MINDEENNAAQTAIEMRLEVTEQRVDLYNQICVTGTQV